MQLNNDNYHQMKDEDPQIIHIQAQRIYSGKFNDREKREKEMKQNDDPKFQDIIKELQNQINSLQMENRRQFMKFNDRENKEREMKENEDSKFQELQNQINFLQMENRRLLMNINDREDRDREREMKESEYSKYKEVVKQLQEKTNSLEMENRGLLKQNSELYQMLDDRDKIIQFLEKNENQIKSQIEIYKIQLEECGQTDSIIKAKQKYEKKINPPRVQDRIIQNDYRNQHQQWNINDNSHLLRDQNNQQNARQFFQNNNSQRRQQQQQQPDVDNMSYEQILELESKMGKVNNGLAAHKINSLNLVRFDSDKMKNINKTCPICQDDYSEGEQLRLLNPCNHFHHSECVDRWLKDSKKCPVCQTEVIV